MSLPCSTISQKREHHNSLQNLSVVLVWFFCLFVWFFFFLNGCFHQEYLLTKQTMRWLLAFFSSSSGPNSLTHTAFSASSPRNVAFASGPVYRRLQRPSTHSAQLSCTQVQLLPSPQCETVSLTKTNLKPNEPFGFQKTDPQGTRTIHAN